MAAYGIDYEDRHGGGEKGELEFLGRREGYKYALPGEDGYAER